MKKYNKSEDKFERKAKARDRKAYHEKVQSYVQAYKYNLYLEEEEVDDSTQQQNANQASQVKRK